MKKSILKSIFATTLFCISLTQAENLPVLQLNLTPLTSQEAALVIKSTLDIGYQSFDFSHIGNHISLFKEIAQQSNKQIFIIGAQFEDLQEIKTEFDSQVGIVWSENGIGQNKLNELKNNRLLFSEGDQGIAQQSVNYAFFKKKDNVFFKLSFNSSEKINVNDLVRQVLILRKLKLEGKVSPVVCLPIQDDAYTNIDPAFLTIAQHFGSKLYQVLFSLISQISINVIPIIEHTITTEQSQEIAASIYKFKFNEEQWKLLKHLPVLGPVARL